MKKLIFLILSLMITISTYANSRAKLIVESKEIIDYKAPIYQEVLNMTASELRDSEAITVSGYYTQNPPSILLPDHPSDFLLQKSKDSKEVINSCVQKYQEFYRKNKIDIRLAYGYLDARISTYDLFMLQQMREKLMEPCLGQLAACGFKLYKNDSNKLIKNIFDVFGEKKDVIISLSHSSATHDERLNRQQKYSKETQQSQTTIAKRNYFGGIEDGADVIIYIGHSRDGGGPSFEPPKIKNGHTDYSWYRRNQFSFKKIQGLLKKAKTKPQLMSFISCNSKKHFYDELKQISPQTGLLLSLQDGAFSNMNSVALTTLDNLLGQKCEDHFNDTLSYSGMSLDIWVLENFFK